MVAEQLSRFKAYAIFNNNGHKNGFNLTAYAGNEIKNSIEITNEPQFVFYNYDYKNFIETFNLKNNSPLNFEPCYSFKAEHEFDFNQLDLSCLNNKENSPSLNINATVSKEEYIKKVLHLKKHIQQGDIYEINFCITFEANNAAINPFHIYKKLNAISKAPYSALVKLNDKFIICSSPELFLSKRGNKITTKPIKGTARRSPDALEDVKIKQELQNNLKERTENVMIVDVARNDLSRIAKKDSVRVEKIYDIESFEQVHQMVSTVSCEIKDNISFEDIIKAAFPMASMTGAPKIRAMQMIDEFEHYNRGPFSGSIGYINKNGDFDLNVLIRSIFYNQTEKYLSFSVGSAITHLCDPEKEYDECMLKAAALIKTLQD